MWQTFTKSKQNFKWVTNNYSLRHYAPHYDMHHYLCPVCNKRHQMNPMSVISFCQNTDALRQQFVHAWPPSFRSLVNQWVTDEAAPAEKTHFFRTLIPSSLLTYLHRHHLLTPLSNPVPAEWYEAPSHRSRLTTECIRQSKHWLHNNQPPSFFHSRSGANYWGSGQFSTSHTPPSLKRPHRYIEPSASPAHVSRNIKKRKCNCQATSSPPSFAPD